MTTTPRPETPGAHKHQPLPAINSDSFPPFLNKVLKAKLLAVSQRTAAKLEKEPWHPAAIEISPRVLRWSRDELLQALAQRAPRRIERSEPPALAAARERRAA